MQDLFGDPRVTIPDNPTLERAANIVMRLVQKNPSLLDGNRVGDIDRKLRVAAWMEQGLNEILNPDQVESFEKWAADPKKCVDTELLRRARQWLVQQDHIRLSATALKDAERQRSRVTGLMRGDR